MADNNDNGGFAPHAGAAAAGPAPGAGAPAGDPTMPHLRPGAQGPAAPNGNGRAVMVHDITIVVPDLRNGRVEDITQAAPKASVAVQYKWAHIEGLDSSNATSVVDAIIRAQYAQVLSGGPADVGDAERRSSRTRAIILGSVRAGAAAAYKLTVADMNSTETVGSGSRIAYNGRNATITAGVGTASPKHAVALSMADLSATEVKVVATLMYLGMAVPVMQGVSLVLSGHHYLPTTKNTFAGMKKQALQVGGADVAAWVETAGDMFDDMAFHKACHPISAPRKRGWAKDSALAARLTASGHGAAAIRLPALPSDAQGGKAALAVVKKASPVILGMGHTVSWESGEALVRNVEVAKEGREELDAVAAVRSWLDANASQIAFCAGIVQTLAEAGTGQQETTLRAYSMRKVISEQVAATVRGNTYCRAYNTRMRQSAESGNFADPALSL